MLQAINTKKEGHKVVLKVIILQEKERKINLLQVKKRHTVVKDIENNMIIIRINLKLILIIILRKIL